MKQIILTLNLLVFLVSCTEDTITQNTPTTTTPSNTKSSKTKKNEEEDQTPTPTKTDQLFSPGVRHIKDFANNNSNNPAGEPIFEN